MANRKTLVLANTPSGCIVPTSHKLNTDGYFRKNIGGRNVMYHRHVWEQEHGPIPEGFEVDHQCKTRACCNVEHLQLLESTTHRSKDNAMRYAPRKAEAKAYWEKHQCTGIHLAERFGVCFGASCRWIREWKQ